MRGESESRNMLETARQACLAGDYAGALRMIDAILSSNPCDIEALRLKGNTIELRIHDRSVSYSGRAADVQARAARECYQTILGQDPRDRLAMKDLAENLANFGYKTAALPHYVNLMRLL